MKSTAGVLRQMRYICEKQEGHCNSGCVLFKICCGFDDLIELSNDEIEDLADAIDNFEEDNK